MTVRKAMTFGSAKIEDVESLINDGNLALEQKYDGTRALVVITTTEEEDEIFGGLEVVVQFLARNGAPLKHTAATQWCEDIEKALRPAFPLPGEVVLDGEIMIDSGAFIIFDLPYMKVEGETVVSQDMPYSERRRILASMEHHFTAPVIIGGMATDPEEKRLLFKSVMDQFGEGVMAKSLSSPYIEGKRVKHSLKVKFVKTADVVVMSVRRGRNEEGRGVGSIRFGVHDSEGVLQYLGKCSPIGKPHCEEGDVIEVRYLYRQAGGSLVQPTMLQVREDREPESCTYEQFTDYSKAIV